MAFAVWTIVSCVIMMIGIRAYFSKKPVYFWANDSAELKVSDTGAYNHAVGKLLITYSVLLILFGLPLLSTSKVMAVITMLGTVFSSIALMAVYTMAIEPKYRK